MGERVSKKEMNPPNIQDNDSENKAVSYSSFHLVGPFQHDGQTFLILEIAKLLQKKLDKRNVVAVPVGPGVAIRCFDVLVGPRACCNLLWVVWSRALVSDFTISKPLVEKVPDELALEDMLS